MTGGNARPPLRLIGIFAKTVHDQGHLLLLHHFHPRQTGRADQLRLILGDRAAGVDNDLTGPLTRLGIDDVVDRDLAHEFAHTPSARDLFLRRLVKELEDLGVVAVLRVHRPQQRERGKLTALVDPNLKSILLRDIELDPTTTLRNDPAVVGLPVGRLRVGHEVDTRRPMQLAHHDPLGTIDDELTTAKHDRNVAEIDFFFDRLLASQPQPYPQRTTIRQPQLTTFIGIVSRLPQLIPEILEFDRLVVALDRENLPKHTLDPLILPLRRRNPVLKKRIEKTRLDLSEVGDWLANAAAAVMTNLGGLETADGAGCHRENDSSE